MGGADEWVAATLLARGRLKEADLARVRRLQEETGSSLLEILSRLGLVSERDHAEACAEVFELPLVAARDLPEDPPPCDFLSIRFMKQFHAVVVAETPDGIDVVLADPQDDYITEALRLASGRDVRLSVALRSEIDGLVERWHGQGRSAMGALLVDSDVDQAEGDPDDVEHLRDLASEAPVIRLVNLIIQRAVELRASDIHIEPFESRLKTRYRIDGILEEGESPPQNLTAAVISRIKIMAKLNIAERRLRVDRANRASPGPGAGARDGGAGCRSRRHRIRGMADVAAGSPLSLAGRRSRVRMATCGRTWYRGVHPGCR